jgi:hypothetical protein
MLTGTAWGECDSIHHHTSYTPPPLLWRQVFNNQTQRALITADRPTGTLSISDLDFMALIAHKEVLAQRHPVAERTLWMATDNKAALLWSEKGSGTSTAARAYLLLYNSLHQRRHRYVATHSHIAGTANAMADDASRLWHLPDQELLTYFSRTYPQESPWELL